MTVTVRDHVETRDLDATRLRVMESPPTQSAIVLLGADVSLQACPLNSSAAQALAGGLLLGTRARK